MQKIILGTVQFGSDYGIKHDGQPSLKEIEKIAQVAWNGGIRVIHTSWQYGLPKICEAMFSEFGWMVKDDKYPDLFYWNRPFKQRIGKSIYSLNENHESYSLLIVPVNILDNRFLKLKTNITEIIARSVFLQGLLLMENLPLWLSDKAFFAIHDFQKKCNELKLKYYEAALGWVLGLEDVDHVIVGVNSAKQLEQLLAVKPLQWDYDFSITDENILDPRRWPTLDNQLKRTVETSTAIEGVNIKL